MRLAVKFYKDVPNPNGLPPEWPAECIELKTDNDVAPLDYAEMTLKEYEAYRSSKRSEYIEWERTVLRPKEQKREKLSKLLGNLQTLAESYKDLQEQGETLTQDQLDIIAKYDKYSIMMKNMG